ncbi:LamB/YcsF family protein [Cochlodiniinecator piscidefendens]|uniref:LamB/YcsF family protein n=1 Tax=Cochlodiniinecator piscidefendens TaxID=2715756 RepID=UPI00140B8B9A|nr:5-oxoprolinase subunit PxpA [Cochlodiniinecator piscidefendens]
MKQIDLNADLGEGFGPWSLGDDVGMMQVVTSANIACGGHASDPTTMRKTLLLARENGVAVGAHPGFADREGFGRRLIPLTMEEVENLVASQIGALMGMAALVGVPVDYVKPHGMLNNWAAGNREASDAICRAVKAVMGPDAVMLAVSETELEHAARDHGLTACSEIFADRGYTPQGQLVPRGADGAMIHDVQQAVSRLLGFLESGLMPTVGGAPIPLNAQSICIHGDGPNAYETAKSLREALESDGVTIRAFGGGRT